MMSYVVSFFASLTGIFFVLWLQERKLRKRYQQMVRQAIVSVDRNSRAFEGAISRVRKQLREANSSSAKVAD